MAHLDKLGATAANDFARKARITPLKAAADLATEGKLGILEDAVKPTVLGDDALLGEMHRNALRKDVNMARIARAGIRVNTGLACSRLCETTLHTLGR